MVENKGNDADNINISISGNSLNAGKDINIKGKEIRNTTMGDVGHGSTAVVGDENSIQVLTTHPSDSNLEGILIAWKAELDERIRQLDVDANDKEELKEVVSKLETEILKAGNASPGRIEKLLNILAVMGPDIFDVAVATLASPLQGIGLVLKKISDRVKVGLKK